MSSLPDRISVQETTGVLSGNLKSLFSIEIAIVTVFSILAGVVLGGLVAVIAIVFV